MTPVDTLITNASILTMDSRDRIFAPGYIAIKNDRIVDLGLWNAGQAPEAREVLDAKGGVVMPGLINAHTHLPMSIFRGMADDLPLDKWLQEHIFPAEARHIVPDSVTVGVRLSVAEMLLSGTTCCCDGYFLADQIAKTLEKCGMRAVSAQGVIDFPAPGVPYPDKKIEVVRAHLDQWRDRSSLISPSVFCHSPYTCSSDTLTSAKALANDAGVLFQIHVAETKAEREQCIKANGCSPVAYLYNLGILDERSMLVHAVWVDEADMELMARTGCAVAHCPESNMKLASGVAPLPAMLQAGLRVGLGTDGCASNNDLDMLGEMDTAAKLHKVHTLDPTAMDAYTVVRLATIDGAKTLGLGHLIGSLEEGKQADLILLDFDQPHLTPCYRLFSHLVYAARGSDVRHVMTNGHWVVKDRCLTTIDLEAVLSEARKIKLTISAGFDEETQND